MFCTEIYFCETKNCWSVLKRCFQPRYRTWLRCPCRISLGRRILRSTYFHTTGKGRNEWKSNIGKTRNTLFSVIENVNIFHAIRERIRMISTVFSAIVRCMHWETNAEAISGIRIQESRTVRIASFLIREKIMAM